MGENVSLLSFVNNEKIVFKQKLEYKNLEKMDKQSEFAKNWNETTIKERKQEILVIDKILKNLIRF